jgi:hypothetical protein
MRLIFFFPLLFCEGLDTTDLIFFFFSVVLWVLKRLYELVRL